ncbi:small nuclear RNA activating complex, subunit SNAP43-domain-containing protein [Umbelopsis sp. PMI_123]|nr:small nuclear RNA activating complex, subunit SNAP43-domain-containing protein [Umbelopsis sp. PMI_123]
MASYLDSEPIITVGNEAISRNAIERDIFLLIHSFARQEVHSLETFSNIWKEYNFSLIHFACSDQQGRPIFMQAVNEAILEHFCFETISVRLGVIFSLYLMYFSQPDIWPREPIRVTAETWNSILDFMDQCDERGCGGDGHTALTKLLNDEAFKFCALQSVKEASIFEQNSSYETQAIDDYLREVRRRHRKSNISSNLNREKLDAIDVLSQKYMDAKKELFNTRHGTLAAQKVMKDLANIQETNPTHLRRVLQSSSLGHRDEAFVSSIRDIVSRYEEARFNSVVHQQRKASGS